jgi:hypothetical protein
MHGAHQTAHLLKWCTTRNRRVERGLAATDWYRVQASAMTSSRTAISTSSLSAKYQSMVLAATISARFSSGACGRAYTGSGFRQVAVLCWQGIPIAPLRIGCSA